MFKLNRKSLTEVTAEDTTTAREASQVVIAYSPWAAGDTESYSNKARQHQLAASIFARDVLTPGHMIHKARPRSEVIQDF